MATYDSEGKPIDMLKLEISRRSGRPYEEITDEQRAAYKAWRHGSAYGMRAAEFAAWVNRHAGDPANAGKDAHSGAGSDSGTAGKARAYPRVRTR